MAVGSEIKKNDIVNKFISDVYNFIVNQAPRDLANNPLIPTDGKSSNYSQLRNKSTLSDSSNFSEMFTQGTEVDTSDIVSTFKNYARALTAIRRTNMYIRGSTQYGVELTVLNSGYAISLTSFNSKVASDEAQLQLGKEIKQADINAFITRLRTVVNNFITTASIETITACHSSCHGSCHGSRGRR